MQYKIQNRQDDNVSTIVEGDTWLEIAEAIADYFDYALLVCEDETRSFKDYDNPSIGGIIIKPAED